MSKEAIWELAAALKKMQGGGGRRKGKSFGGHLIETLTGSASMGAATRIALIISSKFHLSAHTLLISYHDLTP